MGKFDLYKISLKDMSFGSHEFEYVLDNKFFGNIDGDEFRKGNVKVHLKVNKTSLSHEFLFQIDGVIQIPCDRCLDEMDQEISTKSKLYVKLGKEYSEESDEVVIIPEDEGEINIAWFLYEFIALAIPIKHVHPAGKCNKTMTAKLRKHITTSYEDEEGNYFESEPAEEMTAEEENEEAQTDPRWDELKKLIDNN